MLVSLDWITRIVGFFTSLHFWLNFELSGNNTWSHSHRSVVSSAISSKWSVCVRPFAIWFWTRLNQMGFSSWPNVTSLHFCHLLDQFPVGKTNRSQRRFREMHIPEWQLHSSQNSTGLLYLQVCCLAAVSDLGARSGWNVAENGREIPRVSGCSQSVCAGQWRNVLTDEVERDQSLLKSSNIEICQEICIKLLLQLNNESVISEMKVGMSFQTTGPQENTRNAKENTVKTAFSQEQ